MLIKYPITLNCKKTNIQKRIKANTGEGNERELIITLTDVDKKLNLYNRGFVAAIVGVKPDGTKFSNSAVIAEDSTIRYTLTTQNVATEGTVDCQVRILDNVDTGVLFSAKFCIEVEANLSDEEAEESSNEWTELIAALDKVYKQVTVYQGSGAPTGTDFENIKVSDFYYDTLNKDYYYCAEIHRAGGGQVIIEIIWKKLLNSIPDEYVKFSDYPTYVKAGVVKKGSGFEVDENGAAIGVEYGSETVPVLSGRTFMSKTTVLNLIDYLELVNETQLQEGLDEKQDTLTAGNGIDITGTTISAKVRNLGDNALTNHQNGLYVSKYTLGFDTELRQNLADTAASKALASKAYVDELMSGAVKRLVVQTLPVSDIDENTIYMLPKTTAETDNIYDEYMYINNAWELIGTTEVDLTDYYTKTEVDTALADKQDTMSDGNGIDINGDTISLKISQNGGGSDYLNFDVNDNGLYINYPTLAENSYFREKLTDTTYNKALASKSFVYTEVATKQNAINASNKLDADYLSDGQTNKPSYWNKAPKLYKGFGQPSTTASSYVGIKAGDFYLDEHSAGGNGNLHLYQCTFYYMDSLIWKEVAYTSNIKQVPTSTSADNGKFLRVNAQGEAQWQTDNKQDKTTITTNSTDTTVSLTLADNNEYRYTQDLTSLTLTMPSGDFISSVVFVSGTTPTQMTYDSSIKWSGDDVTSNAFVPQASKTYNIVFWFDGININAIARGV